MAVAASAGPVIIGGTALQTAGTLLEVQAPNSTLDPVAAFGSTANTQSYSVFVRNNAGTMRLFAAGGANGFLTGTIAGDVGAAIIVANKFLHLGGTLSVVKVGRDNSLALQAATAVPAGGSAGASFSLGTSGPGFYCGSGAPTVSAPKGSLYVRTDGTTTNDRAYINTNASTTWTALTTVA